MRKQYAGCIVSSPRRKREAIIAHGVVHHTPLREINDKLFIENEKTLREGLRRPENTWWRYTSLMPACRAASALDRFFLVNSSDSRLSMLLPENSS